MLSEKPIKNVAQASHYFYEQDNYYLDDPCLHSRWLGKGAQALGLTGQVERALFNELLAGKLPNGQQIGLLKEGKLHHRPGFDLTFSAPKSVSILSEIVGDERIYIAHEKAVHSAFAVVEEMCAQARQKKNGKMHFERTGNLVAATFRHDLSRHQEPQLHTHCVVMNMTQRQDGQWRSLASHIKGYTDVPTGFLERVRKHKLYLGMAYRATLAYEMAQLGYGIVKTHEDGRFEVAGIDKTVIDAFSSRRRDIKAFLDERGWMGARAAAFATLETRASKEEMDKPTLKQRWNTLCQTLQFDGKKIVEKAKACCQEKSSPSMNTHENPTPHTEKKEADKAVLFAIAHASEKGAVLSYLDLVNTAVHACVGKATPKAIIECMQEKINANELIGVAQGPDNTLFTTRHLLQQENHWLRLIADNQWCLLPWFSQLEIQAYGRQAGLSAKQQQGFDAIAASCDKITLLAGIASSGKTTLLMHLATMAQRHQKEVIYLTPTTLQQQAAQSLFKHAQTVQGFLTRIKEGPSMKTPDLILVDNAQGLHYTQLIALSEHALTGNARLVIAGDDKRIHRLRQGVAFSQALQMHPQAYRLETPYQAPLTLNQKGIHAMALGNVQEAIAALSPQWIEIPTKEERLLEMGLHYVRLYKEDPWQVKLLMSTKKEAHHLNEIIRQHLKKHHVLSYHETPITIDVPQALSLPQRKNALHYHVGWKIQFHKALPTLPIQRGECYRIVATDPHQNQLTLATEKNKQMVVALPRIENYLENMSLFSGETRLMAVGEQVCALASSKRQGLILGEKYQLKALYKNSMVVEKSDGTRCVWPLHPHHPLSIDYGYAATAAGAPTLPVKYVLSDVTSYTNRRQLYHTLVQAQKECWVYTDNTSSLKEQLLKETSPSITAMDAVLQQSSVPHASELHPLKPAQALLTRLEEQYTVILKNMSPVILDNYKELSVEALAQQCAKTAVSILSEKETAFTYEALMVTALSMELGNVPVEVLTQAIQDAKHNGWLVKGIDPEKDLWTTPSAIAYEKEIIEMVSKGRGCAMPIYPSDEKLGELLKATSLKDDQQTAAFTLLTSCDQFMLLQAVAGTGKTALMETVGALARLKDGAIQLQGIAPTHEAVKELAQRGIPSQTLASFLIQTQKPPDPAAARTLYVLDETSMVNNRDLHRLLSWFSQHAQRLLLMGDQGQLLAISDGKPFSIVQIFSTSVMTLTDIKRQAPEKKALKQAISHTLDKNYSAAFDALDKQSADVGSTPRSQNACIPHIIEIKKTPDNEIDTIGPQPDCLDHLSADYLARTLSERKHTLLITPKNEDRQRLNYLIREGLKKEGTLMKDGAMAPVLQARFLTPAQLTEVQFYNVGDTLRFNQSVPGIPVTKETVADVIKIDVTFNVLHLKKKEGQTFSWCVPKDSSHPLPIEVYTKACREVCIGDAIRWRRSDRAHDLLGGMVGRVLDVNETSMFLVFNNGKTRTLLFSDATLQHWDYAYASTTHLAQGKTQKDILAYIDANSPTTTSRNFYTMITRGCHEVTIWTNNKERALKAIQTKDGDKTSALETMGWADVPHVVPTKVTPSTNTPTEKTSYWDAAVIHSRLNEKAEEVLLWLMGKPKSKNAREWRYGGDNPSFAVSLLGAKRGLWHDFQQGEGGNLLDLVAKHHGLCRKNDFPQLLEIAANYLNLSKIGPEKIHIKSTSFSSLHSEKEARVESQSRLLKAKQIASQSIPITGTLAERYLREHRHITGPLGEDLKFHPGLYSPLNKGTFAALIAIARNDKGDIQAVQATYLDPGTANKAEVAVKKQTFGILKGARVTLQRGVLPAKGSLYCEGVETGLSLKEADNEKSIYAVLGISNFKHVPLGAKEGPALLCLDNDGRNSAAQQQIKQACQRLCEANMTVYVNQPLQEKTDYNDVLKQQGADAIQALLNNSFLLETGSSLHAFFEKSGPFEKPILNGPSSFLERLKQYHQQRPREIDNKALSKEHNPTRAAYLDEQEIER